MLDVADRRGQRAFVVIDDPPRHVLGRQTVIGPDGCDHGDPYVWEDIGRRAPRGASAENEDEDGQNDERIGPLKGHDYNRIHGGVRPDSAALTYPVSGELRSRTKRWRLGGLVRHRRILRLPWRRVSLSVPNTSRRCRQYGLTLQMT